MKITIKNFFKFLYIVIIIISVVTTILVRVIFSEVIMNYLRTNQNCKQYEIFQWILWISSFILFLINTQISTNTDLVGVSYVICIIFLAILTLGYNKDLCNTPI